MPAFPVSDALRERLGAISGAGGRPVIVGGAVRDHLLGLRPKDIDIEVFGLPLSRLESALGSFRVDAVGRSFAVLKVRVEAEEFDVALPRFERKTGTGHRAFEIEARHDLDFHVAALRRDFTINAIGWDASLYALVDPHGGQRDLEARMLRHVSEQFDEDPLRVLRGCQFAGRFGFRIHESTLERCRALRSELDTLAHERVWGEWQKLLLRSPAPSMGLDALVATHAIELLPELEALQGVPQDPEWHPEGDVWVHTCMVVDAAARIVRDEGLGDDEALITMLGALCHDLGKPATTVHADGRWRAHDHEARGAEPTRSLLARIGVPPSIAEDVVPLVEHHLKPRLLFQDRASPSAIRRLAMKAPLARLCRVAKADFLGRTTDEARQGLDEAVDWVLARAAELQVDRQGPRRILLGRHLLALGLKPGPRIGELLSRAFEAQLEGAFDDEAGAVAWALAACEADLR